jgi:hypothetical protein
MIQEILFMNDKQDIFEAWAPPEGVWSAWAKPVLFAHLPRTLPEVDVSTQHDLTWVPSPGGGSALIVELPGVESVAVGLALAEAGYRPVPLFNACPEPEVDEMFFPTLAKKGPLSLVDVDSIMAALVQGAERLRSLALPPEARPAFLLDALRNRPCRPYGRGMFDNRSVVFVTDFPSAHTLKAQGIVEATVILREAGRMQRDLEHVLRTWGRDGAFLSLKRLDRAEPIQVLELPRRSTLLGLSIRLASWFGLRRNPEGDFGDYVPEVSGG